MNSDEYRELRELERCTPERPEAMIQRKKELWEKYAPAAWQAPYEPGLSGFNVWVMRPNKDDPAPPGPNGRWVLQPPLGTKSHELRWLLRNQECVETMMALAREGYTRYRAAMAEDAAEHDDAKRGYLPDPKHPTLLVKLKFETKLPAVPSPSVLYTSNYRWALDSGPGFFEQPLFGWLHATLPRRTWLGKEPYFSREEWGVQLIAEGLPNPMGPLRTLEDTCGVHVTSTGRAARRTGEGWTQKLPDFVRRTRGDDKVPPPANLVLSIPYDHPGHT